MKRNLILWIRSLNHCFSLFGYRSWSEHLDDRLLDIVDLRGGLDIPLSMQMVDHLLIKVLPLLLLHFLLEVLLTLVNDLLNRVLAVLTLLLAKLLLLDLLPTRFTVGHGVQSGLFDVLRDRLVHLERLELKKPSFVPLPNGGTGRSAVAQTHFSPNSEPSLGLTDVVVARKGLNLEVESLDVQSDSFVSWNSARVRASIPVEGMKPLHEADVWVLLTIEHRLDTLLL